MSGSIRNATQDGEGAAKNAAFHEVVFLRGSETGNLVRDFDWSGTPLGDPEGWPQSLRTIVRVMLTSRFAMWMGWGPELTFLYNDAYARMTLGKKHPWALGKPSREVWAEIWEDISPRIQRVLDTGEATWDEALLLFLERSGYREETYHTFSYSPLHGDDGRVMGNLCVVSEETERVIGERRLTTLRCLASELSTTSTERDVMSAIERSLRTNTKDLPFTLTYLFNREIQARLGCATGIESNLPVAPPVRTGHDTHENWPIEELLARKAPIRVDELVSLLGPLPTGPWRESAREALLVPIASQTQENPAGIFIAALNPYRQLDANYNGFLELIAGQISGSLANARAYEQERRRAESLSELDRAKTTFFSNISHEFRTPLTLMLGPLENLLDNQSAPEFAPAIRQEVETIQRNGLRLLKLVNSLLDFSRLEAGRIQATYRAVDLASRTEELASVFRSTMERAGLSYFVNCEPLPEPVYVDLEMWERIVLNLLSNAFKFTLTGKVEVNLRAKNGSAELSIVDTGTGIPEAELPRIFERFHRIEGAPGRTHEGTGIGLALVDELVRLHGGVVRVESRLNSGTSFCVSIPFGVAHLPPERVTHDSGTYDSAIGAAPFVQEALRWLPGGSSGEEAFLKNLESDALDSHPGQPQVEIGKRASVLLVDDNRDMREYVDRLLRRRFDVISASNGIEALAAIRTRRPDLVLTDIMMPEMNGFEFLRAFRADPATSTIPVILLSARAGEEAESAGLEAGADDYLVKPFTARELMARVGAHISMYQLRLELMRKEQDLRMKAEAAEHRYRAILESISEGFLLVDRNWRIVYANEQWAALGSLQLSEAIGKVLWDMFPGLSESLFGRSYREAMETHQVMRVEEFYKPLNRWFHANIYPSSEGISIFAQDVTERRRHQDQLLLSEKLAATGRLAATIAHEINNPLESVLNLIYLARTSRDLSERLREILMIAETEVTRVSHIARHTLGFYRDTSAPSQVDMAALMEEVLTVYESRLRAGGIEVRKDFTVLPPVEALRGEMHQVFSNLFSNAIDAMRDGGTLTISLRENEQDTSLGIRVRIEDNGIGIPPENLDKLFEAFFTTKPSTGTGLGLWVVKQFVESWGGRIEVTSSVEPDTHGTAFTLLVPLVAVSESSPKKGMTGITIQ
ncbi:MAG TPA: ATP-binding protein [Terracidiphilus sp.]|jgi:PAS domain S-box-containing protein|nr:ATP-binding protein [Terracidiphilus sp.]